MLLLLRMILIELVGPQMRQAQGRLAIQAHPFPDFRLRSLGLPPCHPFPHLLALLPAHLELAEMRVRRVDWRTQLALLVELLHLEKVEVEVVQMLHRDLVSLENKQAFRPAALAQYGTIK